MPSKSTIKSFYTDGACIGNPGPGGWGIVTYFTNGSVLELGDSEIQTTNNRMEMQAVITALRVFAACEQQEPIIIYTDSQYVIKGITQWIKGWKRKGWQTSQGKAVLNQDLWQKLDQLNSELINWQYVRGHSGNEGNERCDAIANGFARGNPPSLQQQFPLTNTILSPEISKMTVAESPNLPKNKTIVYKDRQSNTVHPQINMSEPSVSVIEEQQLPREVRVTQLRNVIETLRIAEEVASKGYLISSSELADIMDINASAVTSRGDNWPWRNWVVSRVRREGNQILWQLERVD